MFCNLKKTDYVSKKDHYPLYMCTRWGCRGHVFDTGRRPLKLHRNCNHKSIGLGDVVAFFAFPVKLFNWLFGIGCNCESRQHKLNKTQILSPLALRKLKPWDNPIYRNNLIHIDELTKKDNI